MKVICTTEEKELLVESIVKSPLCPLLESIDCPVEICQRSQCIKCMNGKIQWEIEDGEQG